MHGQVTVGLALWSLFLTTRREVGDRVRPIVLSPTEPVAYQSLTPLTCSYHLTRFKDALPVAVVIPGVSDFVHDADPVRAPLRYIVANRDEYFFSSAYLQHHTVQKENDIFLLSISLITATAEMRER